MEEVPPGQVPTRITPMASSVGRWNTCVSAHARNGMRVNCATQPIITSFGRLNTTLKSPGFRVRPMPNITMPSRLLTHAVFTTLNGPGKNRAPAATTITMAAMYLPTKSLTFSSVFIIASPFPSDMLWDKSIRKIKRPCPLRSVRDKGV